ncbi:MAG TPA: SCO family protein [Pyrinomonadaceae bacterium]
MRELATTGALPEPQFAALVDALAADPDGRGRLTELLREDHPLYDQRGAAATVRMRGWVLHALARAGVSDGSLIYVLEELDSGSHAYLVAAAAFALRSYPTPTPALAPFVMRALTNIRYHDEPVTFEGYGEYALSSDCTSPVRELLATLAWLGPLARGVLPEVEALRAEHGLPKKLLPEVGRAAEAIGRVGRADGRDADDCCALPGGLGDKFSWALGSRRGCGPVEATVFEDQDGASATFGDLFAGRPSVVVFFYTRCDNPLKCSLTVTKLARFQKLLEERGLAGQINTAAITYDPAFDLPGRLRAYGRDRGLRFDARHRMLRATEGAAALRKHFKLGVNFIESLVNRHRIEAYVLDAKGHIATSFERLQWDERQVLERAVEVLGEAGEAAAPEPLREAAAPPAHRKTPSPVLGTLASLGVAFFPKCPVCWAGYLSLFGVAGLQQIPYSPWLQPLLIAVMLINLTSVWLRGRSTGRMSAFYLVSAGGLAILLSKAGPGWESAAAPGVAFTLAGSLLSALNVRKVRAAARG